MTKILYYIEILKNPDYVLREQIIKHLEDGIWELRPRRNRILFFFFNGDEAVLSHVFMKDTQKTPKNEIERAKRNREDFIKRS